MGGKWRKREAKWGTAPLSKIKNPPLKLLRHMQWPCSECVGMR